MAVNRAADLSTYLYCVELIVYLFLLMRTSIHSLHSADFGKSVSGKALTPSLAWGVGQSAYVPSAGNNLGDFHLDSIFVFFVV